MKTVGIAGIFAFSANVAAALSIPDCDSLAAWLATGSAPAPFNAAGPLPPAFGTDATTTVFGTSLLDWSAADVRALDSALNGCRTAASRARDNALTTAFTEARRDLTAVSRRLNDRRTALEAIEKALAAVDSAAPSAALRNSLANLAAAPEGGFARAQSPAAEPRPITRYGDKLTEAEGAALRATLAERAEVVAGQLIGAAVGALAATPGTLDGILAVRQGAIDAQARMGDAAAEVIAAAAAREAEIAAALAATDPAPVTLPTCAALVAWAAGLRPQDSRRTRAGIVVTGLEAPELATLFGKPFDRWNATDIDAMGKLAVQCREAGRAGLLGGEPQVMMRAGQNVVILHAQTANQPPIFAALAASRAAADEIATAAAATPDGAEGFAALGVLRNRVAALEEADANRAAAAVEARRAALAAAEVARIEADMSAAPATVEGLIAVLEASTAATRPPLGANFSDAQRMALRTAAATAANRIAPAALPGLQARLAALPESEAGVAEARAIASGLALDAPALAPLRAAAQVRAQAIETAIIMAELPDFQAELAALPQTTESLAHALSVGALAEADAQTSPAYAAFARAAATRAAVLREALAQRHCAPSLAGVSASDAARPVLVGIEISTLGRLFCALGADSPPRYSAPGFFGSQHTVDATVMGGYAVKLILIQGDAPRGGKALIGKRIEDGNGARDVAIAEWQAWSGALSGGAGACAFMAEAFMATLMRGWGADDIANDLALCLIANPDAPIPIGG